MRPWALGTVIPLLPVCHCGDALMTNTDDRLCCAYAVRLQGSADPCRFQHQSSRVQPASLKFSTDKWRAGCFGREVESPLCIVVTQQRITVYAWLPVLAEDNPNQSARRNGGVCRWSTGPGTRNCGSALGATASSTGVITRGLLGRCGKRAIPRKGCHCGAFPLRVVFAFTGSLGLDSTACLST